MNESFFDATAPRPNHWRMIEAALSDTLEPGDLILGQLENLNVDGETRISIVASRPSTQRVLVASAVASPDSEECLPSVSTALPRKVGQILDIGKTWSMIPRMRAERKARKSAEGTIDQILARIWSNERVYIIAKVSRPGMYDCLKAISVPRQRGMFGAALGGWVVFGRPLPRLFVASPTVRVHGAAVTNSPRGPMTIEYRAS